MMGYTIIVPNLKWMVDYTVLVLLSEMSGFCEDGLYTEELCGNDREALSLFTANLLMQYIMFLV